MEMSTGAEHKHAESSSTALTVMWGNQAGTQEIALLHDVC